MAGASRSRLRTSLSIPALAAIVALAGACVRAGTVPVPGSAQGMPILWRNPPPAPPAPPPRPPFQFVEEDFDGDSPKFTVRDGNDARWRVKLGPEAHTEIAAGALLAATGFFTDEMHYLERARVDGIDRLKRGREFVEAGGNVRAAQFEARPTTITRGDTWQWSENPFAGTDPLDGLRVLMVLINNYDARTANNRILLTTTADGGRQSRYVVTDLGASFGRYGGLGGTRTKSDLPGYRASPFIEGVQNGVVHFAYQTRPEGVGLTMFVFNPFYAFGELRKQRDMERVPLGGVRWITRLLQQIDPATIRTAFEEAGYGEQDAAGFAAAVRDRIRQLAAL